MSNRVWGVGVWGMAKHDTPDPTRCETRSSYPDPDDTVRPHPIPHTPDQIRSSPDMAARFTLRHLPLPAKLVVSAFLISVGVGYFSALVQLHMQHGERDGNPLPTPENVIEHFSGVKKFDGVQPVSKLEGLINGDPEGGFSKANMAIAFFAKSTGYDKEVKDRGEKNVRDERDGERKLLTAWLNLPADQRKAAFEANAMPLPTALAGQPLTIYGAGDQTRSFCYVDDLVRGFWELLQSEHRGPMNMGNPGEFTMVELASLVLELTGSASGIEYRELPEDDPKQRQPDIAVATAVLGWEPSVDLRTGLRHTIDWFRSGADAS